MAAVRCPTTVGRRAELTALRSGLAAARLGRGATAVLSGPPGIGKSRLARETASAAQAWDLPVLVGRAVESGHGTAFRPLAEALLGGLRRVPEPDDPALAPFRPALGRLVPQWRVPAPSDDSLVVLGEAVLRLLAALAGDGGLLLVLEDLHWADPETLAVLEYVADNVAQERVLVLVTARDDPGPPSTLVRALAARGAASVHRLAPLDDDEVAEMVRACRDGRDDGPPADVLAARSGGTPLFVEELLAADDPSSHVPAGVADLFTGRVAALPAAARSCLEAAAVLGERFDWRLLPAVTGLSDVEVAAGLRAAVGAGLVETAVDDGFRFHHALGRDAVLAAMLAPERVGLARRASAAVEQAHPGLDGAWCDVAADLALQAGDAARAAAVLTEAGRRNLTRGALGSAESVLVRARELAGAGDEIDELLSRTLVLAGKTDAAVTVTTRMIDGLSARGADASVLAAAELRLAEAWTTAGDWPAAEACLDRARRLATDPDLQVRIAAVGARVALDDSRFDDARRLAEQALTGGDAEVRCAALTVLGRIARRQDLAAADELFTRARRTAEEAGLPVAAARAAEEIAIGDVQESLRIDRLSDARERARALGDVGVVAVLDLQAAAIHNSRWEADEGVAAAQRCVAASRRFRLATLPKALVLGAVAHDYRGDTDTSDAWLAEALTLAPDDTHLRGEVSGARAYRHMAAADDARALAHLDAALASFALRPNEVTGSPVVGCWLLMRTALDPAATSPPVPPDPIANRWNRGLARFADAVALGRAGKPVDAAAAFADADAVMRDPVPVEWFRLQARRVTAAAALADGWGEPARWAAEDLVVLDARREERWAAAVRGLLRRAGVAVPRRGRGGAEVPATLRALGVTSRETDVLRLVAEGCSTREIAERLFLSPRTVEKHVERLLAKTGTTRRTELVAYAARTGV
ncbi:MAG: AAA family ATPase [Pseudonocardia sp.]|uniref:ATP-binding protein n=1 Tax=unclassified Pseudonocardia TaxID=2619320 RepID=UPI000ABBDB70|nr:MULTISPECIES: LuxR family transcriptional regulator [unclassified Pseudonocardia]MBN9111743.1 AAA family ATPase [Pseudonocardia sp.]